jgi:hypothetical protein
MHRATRLLTLAVVLCALLGLGMAPGIGAQDRGADTFTDPFEVHECFPFDFPEASTLCIDQQGVVHVTETPNGQITTTVNGEFCFTLTAQDDGSVISDACTRLHDHERVQRLGPSFFMLVMDHRNLKQEGTILGLECRSQIIFHYANGEVRVDDVRGGCS